MAGFPEVRSITFASVEDRVKGEKIVYALQEALKWEEEYRLLNHLHGSPYWVSMAHDAFNF